MAVKKALRVILYLIIALVAVGLFALYRAFGPNTGSLSRGEFFYLHTGWGYETMKDSLESEGFIADKFSFDVLAKIARLPAHVHPGKYKITKGMSNYNIIRMLRSGRQTPVKLVINKLRTRHDFISLLAANLEPDSATLQQFFTNDYLSQFGFDTTTMLCAILPDTYDFYWNTTGDRAFRKIEKNYKRFWDDTRREEAKQQGLNPIKATVLASIVDEETNINDDKPKIASVYLNRLNKGMKLQADPTVKFAAGDFAAKRIAGDMLQNPSPYNTYMYEGLPPGPICTPSPISIDAVLKAPKTTYLYFCAKDDFSGYSVFASTYDEQLKNAHAYQKALDARGIQ